MHSHSSLLVFEFRRRYFGSFNPKWTFSIFGKLHNSSTCMLQLGEDGQYPDKLIYVVCTMTPPSCTHWCSSSSHHHGTWWVHWCFFLLHISWTPLRSIETSRPPWQNHARMWLLPGNCVLNKWYFYNWATSLVRWSGRYPLHLQRVLPLGL